jgi:hypothetical protein
MVKYIVDLPTEDDAFVQIIEMIISKGFDSTEKYPAKHFLLIQEKLGEIAGIVYRLDDEPSEVGLLVETIIELSSETIRWIHTLYSGE